MYDSHSEQTDRAPSALFSCRLQSGVHVITFSRSDVLDANYIESVGNDIYHYLKPLSKPLVVIDMEGVRLLSSSALGMLMAIQKVVLKQNGNICIANVDRDVMKVFKMTRLEKVIDVHDGTVRAIDSLL